jgi:Galactose oxidase, central domain
MRSRMRIVLTAATVAAVAAVLVPLVEAGPALAAAPVAPPVRWGHAMAYDAAHAQVVLFGGYGGSGADLNDTWTWDGTDWTQRTPAHSPAVRENPAMAYDAGHAQVVLFGGAREGGYLGDTWTWDSAPTSPTPGPGTAATGREAHRRMRP